MLSAMLFAATCSVRGSDAGKKSNVFYGDVNNEKESTSPRYIQQLNKIRKILAGTSILVIRHKNDRIRGSKPCMHCCLFMKRMGIKNIYYSNDDGSITKEKVSMIKSDHLSLARRLMMEENEAAGELIYR